MTYHLQPGGRDGVLMEILERILTQEDDTDRMHDGYQRRLVMVEAHTKEEADQACEVLAQRVREAYATKGRDRNVLSVMRCEDPPGRRRYEFGPAHGRQIMGACGNGARSDLGVLYAMYDDKSWTEPKLLFIANADAMAQAGRNHETQWMRAGDFIRALSDSTRVRQVLFGTAALRNIYETNERFQYRTDAYHLDPEENRKRLRAAKPGTSELNWRIATGATVH